MQRLCDPPLELELLISALLQALDEALEVGRRGLDQQQLLHGRC